MMEVSAVKELVKQAFSDDAVEVSDMTGTQDHFQITVVSKAFEGKMLVAQHQMVQKPVQEAMNDGRIHAIAIKTYTPVQWEKERSGGDQLHSIG